MVMSIDFSLGVDGVSKISKLSDMHKSEGLSISGQGMDRVVEKKIPFSRKAGYGIAGLLLVIFGWWLVDTLLDGRSLSVDSRRIAVSTVTTGTFEDYIPLRGRLMPRSTVYLDAIEGGRVDQVLIEDGATVKAGDPIAVLSNTNLQLVVLGREAEVTEQLNFMRTIELQLEQNRLSHKRNLIEIDYQIVRLTRSIERQRGLALKDLVSQSTIDELEDELKYYHDRREVTLESQATDARLQEQQLKQLREAGEQLRSSLEFARKNLDDLNIRAPIAGKLSGFNIEVGQSIERGGRLGQIDDPEGFKLRPPESKVTPFPIRAIVFLAPGGRCSRVTIRGLLSLPAATAIKESNFFCFSCLSFILLRFGSPHAAESFAGQCPFLGE